MSTSRYVSRHGTSRRSPFARLGSLPSSASANGARAAAKTVAGVGIVLGSGAFVIAPSSAADTATSTDLASFSADSATVTELLGDRAGDPAASRSTSRAAAAVTAPTGTTAKDVHDTAGALAVDPVVKLKPKPKPKPKPEPVEQPVEEPDTTADPRSSDSQAPEQTSRSSERESVQPESTASSAPEPTQAPSSSVNTSNYASQGAALGLGPNAQKVYSAVRTQFPDMTNIGGFRAGDPGDHGSGNAVDIMVTGSRGDQVNSWLQQNAGSLNIKYIIWQQRIWFPNGTSKMMSDRGSPTQNHYDHVHVSVN
ncbi:hypothetical protein ASG73_06565 [Janibacter sp. Soil728]|uniref:hypothetical protein n=1 Tax=Janibacter sp. Soil728 TaxID=1736393 RepID=UPI0006F26A5B|nr:hypothetical protein [Janibacter sp. Soil728]KRE38581.1 hypothetical protein ASG73_06565 [Janibacter sp. Soil728]